MMKEVTEAAVYAERVVVVVTSFRLTGPFGTAGPDSAVAAVVVGAMGRRPLGVKVLHEGILAIDTGRTILVSNFMAAELYTIGIGVETSPRE